MTTKGENDRIGKVESRMERMEVRVDEIIIPKLEKISDTLDENISGIKLATLLNSKIIAVVLGGMVAAGLFFVAKTGGGL